MYIFRRRVCNFLNVSCKREEPFMDLYNLLYVILIVYEPIAKIDCNNIGMENYNATVLGLIPMDCNGLNQKCVTLYKQRIQYDCRMTRKAPI